MPLLSVIVPCQWPRWAAGTAASAEPLAGAELAGAELAGVPPVAVDALTDAAADAPLVAVPFPPDPCSSVTAIPAAAATTTPAPAPASTARRRPGGRPGG